MKIADMHCDTISSILEKRREGKSAELRKREGHLDLERMKKAGYILQNFALFVEHSRCGNPYEECLTELRVFNEEMKKNADLMGQVRSFEDILRNQECGKMSALLTLEEGEVCLGDVEKLREFYEGGARMMTFTWNYDNGLGTSASHYDHSWNRSYTGKRPGLTETGVLFLEQMEELGIIADVSHLSDAGIDDVLEVSQKPFVASHSNARALCAHQRNLKDEHIRRMGEKGCVIGANYFSRFLREGSDESRISEIADHIEYLIRVGGLECVGLGSDFDGIGCELEMKDCSHMDLLYEELRRRGMKEAQIDRVFYENVLQLYRERLDH